MKLAARSLALLCCAALSACACSTSSDSPSNPAPHGASTASPQVHAMDPVLINGVALDERALQALEQRFGMRLPAGDFWYDRSSGAWGQRGGPALGFTLAGLDVGGPLRADASGGGHGSTTGVFVNGRELHPHDVAGLSQFVQVVPGRYWVDAQGNFGYEGVQWPQGNLVQLAMQQSARGSSYLKRTQAGYIGSDGETSYFFDPQSGASVIPGEGVVY